MNTVCIILNFFHPIFSLIYETSNKLNANLRQPVSDNWFFCMLRYRKFFSGDNALQPKVCVKANPYRNHQLQSRQLIKKYIANYSQTLFCFLWLSLFSGFILRNCALALLVINGVRFDYSPQKSDNLVENILDFRLIHFMPDFYKLLMNLLCIRSRLPLKKSLQHIVGNYPLNWYLALLDPFFLFLSFLTQ